MSLSKEDILHRVHSYDIFTRYLEPYSNGKRLRSGDLILSPLREEKHPSFNIYLPPGAEQRGGWRFKDFAGEGGDCFEFVMQKFNLTFPEALQRIADDFNLEVSHSSSQHPTSPPLSESTPKTQLITGDGYEITVKEFSVKELGYWLQYGITIEQLKLFKVVSLESYSGKSKEGKPYTIRSTETYYIFAYLHDDWIKIYKPQDKKYRFQHLGTKPENFIFGFDLLPEKGDLLFLAAGEKDAITLTTHGFNAISLNSESSNIKSETVAALKLRFKNIIILYDNDKTGQERSFKLSLQHNLKSILLPPMPQGKDISDFFKQKLPLENLQSLILQSINSPSVQRDDDDQKSYCFTSTELLLLDTNAERYLLNPLLQSCGTAVLVGKPDAGKSQFARQLVIHVATGEKKFLGFDLITRHQSAIFIATEDDKINTRFLLQKQLEGLNQSSTDNLRFIFADTLTQDEIFERLKEHLTAKPADLIVIDSFGDIFKGTDLNSNAQMRTTVREFDRIAKQFNCLMLFVHHINKSAYSQAPSQEHIQGGAGLAQKVRSALYLSLGEGNLRYINVAKGNYCPRDFKQNAIELLFDEEFFIFKTTGSNIPIEKLSKENAVKEDEKLQTQINTVTTAFDGKETMRYTDLVRKIQQITQRKVATAKRMVNDLSDVGILVKDKKSNKYTLHLHSDQPEEESPQQSEFPI